MLAFLRTLDKHALLCVKSFIACYVYCTCLLVVPFCPLAHFKYLLNMFSDFVQINTDRNPVSILNWKCDFWLMPKWIWLKGMVVYFILISVKWYIFFKTWTKRNSLVIIIMMKNWCARKIIGQIWNQRKNYFSKVY